ncbi:MAG: SDR family oxidoreductase [Pseudomonadota bacterium]
MRKAQALEWPLEKVWDYMMGDYAVTGGASGIGAAVVAQLREQGHSVLVVDLQNADITADLSSAEGVEQTAAAVRQQCPHGIDGLIPCAGVSGVHPPERVGQINYFGTVRLVDALREDLVRKNGSVVLISSITSSMPSDDDVVDAMLANDAGKTEQLIKSGSGDQAYAASKRAVTCWMRRECASYLAEGVRINAVAPGYIDTPLNDQIRESEAGSDILDQFVSSIPMGRPGKPDDIANVISFLLSEKSSFMAGANVFVDGGHDALFRQSQF